jgi:uncharacterized protein YcfL
MRIVFTLIALSLLMTACGPHDADLRQQVAGTWFQGPHTLTLAPDGSYTSIFPDKPAITYKAKWHIERGFLMMTDVSSNSVPIAGNTTVKIVLVDKHHLELTLGTNLMSMIR